MPRYLQIVGAIYVIYWTVGVGLKVFGVEPPFGAFADFLFIALAAAVVFAVEAAERGWKKTGVLFLLIAIASGAIETIGTLTGWPFGEYYYTANFGPMLGGVLPLAIPLAWWIVMMPVWRLLRAGLPEVNLAVAVVLTACFAVAIDFVIEPMAVVVKGYWVWAADGFYFGVPLSNFFGWLLTALILGGILWKMAGEVRERSAVALQGGLLLSVLFFFAVTLLAVDPRAFAFPVALAVVLGAITGGLLWRGIAKTHREV